MTGSLHLLLVEDDTLDARLVHSLLEPRGARSRFEIHDARDLASALRRMDHHYDVVLCDLALPDSTGLGAFRALHAKAPDLPIVVLTVLEDEEIALQALGEGAQDYLIKGEIDERRLTYALLYAVERQRLVGELRAASQTSADRTRGLEHDRGRLASAMTELRTSLDREQEKARRLEELDRLNTDFLGMFAHDLRAPLQVLSAYSEMLLRREAELSPEKRREYVRRLHRGARHVATLIDNVLHVVKTDSGLTFTYSAGPFDLRMVLERVASELDALEPTPRVRVRISEPLPLAMGDEHRYWQAATNLVSNALKFSGREAPVDVTARVAGSELEVSVTDLGPGIAQRDVPKLFRRFSRLPARDASSARPGTGLGLYISHQIVTSQGGRIWVESRPGEGSTFRFTVPIASVEERA